MNRVHSETSGFGGLSEPEKLYFAVGLVDGEVYNGGFDQYFTNSSGSYYDYAVRGLRALGALTSLALLEDAKSLLFPDGVVPTDVGTRRQLARLAGAAKELDRLDERFNADPDGLSSRLQRFAQEHGLVA